MEILLPTFNCTIILWLFNLMLMNFLFSVSFLSFLSTLPLLVFAYFPFYFYHLSAYGRLLETWIFFVPEWTTDVEMQTTTTKALIWHFSRSSFNFWRIPWKTSFSWILLYGVLNSWSFHIPRQPPLTLLSNPLQASLIYETEFPSLF